LALKLDRMIAREVIVPAALGFVTYTFLLMMRGLFGLIEQIFVRGLPVRDALGVLGLTLPHVVVLTIPMGYLFGVLLAAGRLSVDNEIIALQASGISARRLVRPIVIVAVLLALANGYLYNVVIPQSHRELKNLRVRLFSAARNLGRIQPGVFYEEFPNLLLYVRSVDEETGDWEDVLVYDSSSPGEERLTLAQRGRVLVAGGMSEGAGAIATAAMSQPWIVLEEAVTHQFLRARPATYRVNNNRELRFRPRVQGAGVARYDVAMRERDTGDLVRLIRSEGRVEGEELRPERQERDLRIAELELHRRFAVPAASIVFALLALPLGIGSRSGGRGRGFVISVAVVLVYYVLGNNGEVLAMEGSMPPWLGMWLPSIALTVLAVILMSRMGRWLGERDSGEGPIHRLTRRFQEWRLGRQAKRAAPGHARPAHPTVAVPLEARRQRRATRFPALLDRYVAARLLAPLLLVLASTAALYVVIDLTEHVSAMADNDAPLTVILAYYWNLMPQILVDVIPFGMLIAVLIVLTALERQQELTALKGGGVSLFRLMAPVLLVAIAGGISMWLLSEHVVPRANRDKERLLDVIEGKEPARSYRVTDRQWLLSRDDQTFYNFLRYDGATKTLARLTVYRIDENMRLRFHQFAHRARWEDGAWVADGGWFRQFFPDGSDEFRRIARPLKIQVAEGPDYFGQEYSSPSEMSYSELEQYIDELVESGYQPSQLLVRLYQKISYPLSAVIMVWIAVPFALNRGGRRVTTMQGVALALALGIGYSILVTVFSKLGEAELLPPVAGAWAPVLLGALFAINRMTTLRT
jgi:LPS export ABC transporter permease LptG/LPS export ABC transporter permease LptF